MTTFKNIAIGNRFFLNGTWWVKRSTRTAHVLGWNHRWFYFSKEEVVENDCEN